MFFKSGILEMQNADILHELIESKPKDRNDILFQYSKLENSRKVEIVGFGKWKDYKFNAR